MPRAPLVPAFGPGAPVSLRGFGVKAPARYVLRLRTKVPAANSQVMRRSHTACHAAALAWILNRKLKFDPAKEEFVGDDEANGLRHRPARAPWAV